MANVIIIHGTGSSPERNCFPWLKSEIEKLGHRVLVPKFPTPERQDLPNWLNVFRDYEKYLDEHSIIVGHSLGVGFVLNLLERAHKPVRAAYLVAGFVGLLNSQEFDPLIRTFTDRRFDWARIKVNCRKFYVFHSDNDPYVPLEKGRELVRNLDAEFVFVKGGRHLNTEAGYTQFPLLLDYIKKEL